MRIAAALAVSFLFISLPSAQRPATGLDYGATPVGYRVDALPASDGQLAGTLQLWYPAAESCAAPLTFADYLRADALHPGDDVAAQIRGGWPFTAAPIDDAQWTRVLTTPMRACRRAAPAAGRAPLLLAIQLGGAWPVAAEYFAGHGYAVAVVGRPLAAPPSGAMVDRIAARKRGFVADLAAAIDQLRAGPGVDVTRVGALGQSHALLMLAMARPEVRAVALQDSGFQSGVDADSDRATGLWQPARFSAALLHAIASDRLDADDAWSGFREAATGEVARLIIAPAHAGHNDVTADGYLIRTRAPIASPPHDTLSRVYENLLRAQRAFFDRHVAGRGRAPAVDQVIDGALMRVERPQGGTNQRASRQSPRRHGARFRLRR